MTTKYLDSNGLTYLLAALRPTSNPANLGTAAVGTSKQFAKADHVHAMPSASDVGALPSSTTIPSAGTGSSYPVMDGTRALGSQSGYARVDHVHPSDTSRVPTTRKVNGKALSSDVNITTNDILHGSEHTVSEVLDELDNVFTGPTSSAAGTKGLVPAPPLHSYDWVLYGDGNWGDLTIEVGGSGNNRTIWAYCERTQSEISEQSIPCATTTDAGFMSTTDKAKLSNIDSTVTSGSSNLVTSGAVATAIAQSATGGVAYQGTVTGTFAPTNYTAGWYWIVQTAGTYAGQVCEAGDMIFCKTSGTTYSANNFDVIQTNLDIAAITNSEIDSIVAA